MLWFLASSNVLVKISPKVLEYFIRPLFLFRLATSCVQNTVGCHAINVPKSGPCTVSREIRKRCNKMWKDIGKKFIGELLPCLAKHLQTCSNATITDLTGVRYSEVFHSREVRFYMPCLLDWWKILNLNCGEICKGLDDHHSYIHNLQCNELNRGRPTFFYQSQDEFREQMRDLRRKVHFHQRKGN